MFKRIWLLILLIPAFAFASGPEKQLMVKEGKSRTWLGIKIADLSEEKLKDLNIPNGVRVVKVFKDSPAAEADLQEDDILIALDGRNIKGTGDLIKSVQEKKAGEEVEIEFLRDGNRGKTRVKLAETVMKKVMVRPFGSPHRLNRITEDQTWLGVHTTELSEQLREYFGVPEGQGILIKEVVKDSPADKGGLKAGDIIIKVAEKKVRDLRDVRRAINYFEPGDEIEIKVIREHKEKAYKVKLEERGKQENVFFYGDDENEFDAPAPEEINIEIPEIEIELGDGEDFENLMEDVQPELEFKVQDLNEKLKEMNEKLQNLKVRITTDQDYEFQI